MAYGVLSNAVGISDGANLDAFSRLRISDPVGLFDSTFQYNLQPNIFYQSTANGGAITHDANAVSAVLTTAAQASSSAILQSRAYHRYIPAKSQLIVMTQVVGAKVPGAVKRIGYFDANDGIFLEVTGTEYAIVRRSSVSGVVVDTRVPQSEWNLDTLDGAGPTGLTLDLSKASILVIDLQWLGMGRVRVGFDIDGDIDYAHQFLNANILAEPYMKTANLPVRWEVSGNAVATLRATCSSVISEGGAESDRGAPLSASSPAAISVASGARTHLISFRPAATFNSIVNRIQFVMDEFAALVTGNNPIKLELLFDATVTGGAWAAANAASAAEVNYTATYSTDGIPVGTIYVPATAANKFESGGKLPSSRIPITLDIAGANPTIVSLVATGLGGTSTAWGRLSWRELR